VLIGFRQRCNVPGQRALVLSRLLMLQRTAVRQT
jgi:hypothetical protein